MIASLRWALRIGGLAVLLLVGGTGCQDECDHVIALCSSDLYVAVDVTGATATPVAGATTPPELTCSSIDTYTNCSSFAGTRLEPGTYVYDIAWAGHVQRVSIVATDQSRTCCRRSSGHASVSFREDAGP